MKKKYKKRRGEDYMEKRKFEIKYPNAKVAKTVEDIANLILERKHWRLDIPIILFEVVKVLGGEMDGRKKENND